MQQDGYKWMSCTQCKETVLFNETNVCLACHHIYDKGSNPDLWANVMKKETLECPNENED